MHPALDAISGSLGQDMPLCDADLRASAAYARALAGARVLSAAESEELATSLEEILGAYRAGDWVPPPSEDVHTAIEAEVTARVGSLGERLHTGRSRNDQVATAFRMAVRELIDKCVVAVEKLQTALVDRADQQIDVLMPAYTHLQRAQPIRLSHWLMSYYWPLQRDRERLIDARKRVNVLPLGSGAVSGHPFAIDRDQLATSLGFASISNNSIDAVGDRDFAIEFCFACTAIALHLSRLAEELVTFSSTEFGFIRWPDNLATGSSLMPNKKNPDLAELVRGQSGAAIGDLVSLLALVKGLPASYQRDLQHDKPPVWRVAGGTLSSLEAMAAGISGIHFCGDQMTAALSDDTLATEIADLLVGRGVPFRSAYRTVSRIAKQARESGTGIKAAARQLGAAELAPLGIEDIDRLTPAQAVERRTATGGTARVAVLAQIALARKQASKLTGVRDGE